MMTTLEAWRLRAELQAAIRDFFATRGYLELDTPILVEAPGTEVHLDYFETAWVDHQASPHRLFLRSSPELHLKQALAEGMERVFHLAKCFRNGGELSAWHHPEFTMLEWYETGISFAAFRQQTTDLVRYGIERLGRLHPVSLALPRDVPVITVAEAFARFAGIELIDQDPGLAAKARDRGYHSVRADDDFETAFFKVLLDAVEPELKAMEIVYLVDYPPSQAALAKVEGGVAKRFELYIRGVELCNAFFELVDPSENKRRIREAQARRKELGKQEIGEDRDFYKALERGLKPAAGNALGFDRLLALILGLDGIDQIVPFRRALPYRSRLT